MASVSSDPRAGEILAEKYRVERVLGRGGMGVVVEATHLVLGSRVALKFLLPSAAVDARLFARFIREAQVTSRLKSTHVARTLDMGQLPDGRPFLVMELLEGHDLGEELAQRPRPSVPRALTWVLQACEGIAEAHAAGVVHRDLKPTNLFLARDASGDEVVKVLDFGISKLTTETDAALTTAEAALGSPLYMSPEQLRSSKSADARSDVWSIGVMLYEAVTGDMPFGGDTIFALAQSISSDTPRPVSDLRPDVPAALSEAIASCLAKSPLERPQSVAALADLLAPVAGDGGRELAARVRGALGEAAEEPRARISRVLPDESDRWAAATTVPEVPARGRRLRRLAAAVGALGLVGAAGASWIATRPSAWTTPEPVGSGAAAAPSEAAMASSVAGSEPLPAAGEPSALSAAAAAPSTAHAPAVAPSRRARGRPPFTTPVSVATPASAAPESPFINQRTND